MTTPTSLPSQMTQVTQEAIIAGGCFWCTEAIFKDVRGVEHIQSGYIGGQMANPDYRSVCSGNTGHAEAIKVTFDPAQLSYGDLLRLFMVTHDPTTLNRQGADIGTQYRSAIFPLSAQQEAEARAVLAEMTAHEIFEQPIVTTIENAQSLPFYPAEDYHQDYYARNPNQGYCMAVIAPKVAKLRTYYGDMLR